MGIFVYIYTDLLQLCYGLGIELPPVLFFVSQLDEAGAAEPVSVVILIVYSAC